MIRIGIGMICLLGAAVAWAGCGDDDGRDRPTDSGVTGDSGGDLDAGPADAGFDAGRDAGTTGDGNDDFDSAEDLAFGDTGAEGAIGTAGDHDFFTFEGTAGSWVAISTEANPDDDPEMVDTVITLYDGSMTQIAENDDAFPRASTDSEIIIRLPADDTYYVEVQEWTTWADDTPEGDPSFTYTLRVIEIDPDAAAVTVDTEGGDDAASAQTLGFSMDFQFLLGTFEDDTDVDVFSISVPAGATRLLQATLMPDGTDGYGSTTPAGEVWVTDSAGTTIIARIDQSAGYEAISPSLPEGDYLLWIAHPGGGAGANDFYVAKVVRGTENTPEGSGANGTVAEAEALTLTMAEGTMRRSGFVLAHLDAADDVDYFSFDVAAGETLSVACGSAEGGSGVEGLTVSVRDGDDASVASMTETAPDGVFIEDAGVTEAGTYYLRLSKTGQDAEVTGDWVRCGVHAITAP